MTEPARPSRRRGPDSRIDQQPGFVLHSYPWRETSLIVEVFSRDHGRVALVARGAKRPTSQFRGLLSPFCPLALSWSGKGEVKSLIRIEWLGGFVPLRGEALLAAFYVNELLVRLLARGDAHAPLFGAYVEVLRQLAHDDAHHEAALRSFELDLLTDIGYGLATDFDDEPHVLRGAQLLPISVVGASDDDLFISPRTLAAMAQKDFSDPRVAAEAKTALRGLVRYHLGERPLNTRRILHDLKSL
ncbi:MAG: DNA repair protein RecO [Burkholderiaceae bacterium]